MDDGVCVPDEEDDVPPEPQAAVQASWAASVVPVGMVTSGRLHPQQNGRWGGVVSTVHLDHRFSHDALQGLDEFSHAEILFLFHRASEPAAYRPRRPAGGPGMSEAGLPEVGVFADRGSRRPNRIGVSICEIVKITGHQLTVRDLDAVVGTPVLDIKPVMREYLPRKVHQPAWADTLMRDHFAPASRRPAQLRSSFPNCRAVPVCPPGSASTPTVPGSGHRRRSAATGSRAT